jgi:hypothetical protein
MPGWLDTPSHLDRPPPERGALPRLDPEGSIGRVGDPPENTRYRVMGRAWSNLAICTGGPSATPRTRAPREGPSTL